MWSLKTSSFYLTGSRHLRPIRSRLFESEQVQHGANTIPTLFKFHAILCCCLCCFFQCLLPPAQEWTASQTGTKNNNELPWFLFEVTVMTLRGFLFVLQWFQRQKKKITTSCDFSSYFPFSVNVHCKIFISSVRLPGLPWEYALPRQSDHRPGHCQRLCVWRERVCKMRAAAAEEEEVTFTQGQIHQILPFARSWTIVSPSAAVYDVV